MSKTKAIGYIVGVATIILPSFAFADIQQLSHDAQQDDPGTGNVSYYQGLGTGLTGTITGGYVWGGGGGTNLVNIQMTRCDNAGYSVNCNSDFNVVAGGGGPLFFSLGGSPVNFDSSKYYYLTISIGAGFGNSASIKGSSADSYAGGIASLTLISLQADVQSGNLQDVYFQLVGGNDPNVNFSSRIITNTPYNGQVVASSTTFILGYTGYLNSDDYVSNTKVHYQVTNSNFAFQNCADVICASIASESYNFENYQTLTSGGDFSYSSTTSLLNIGRYYAVTTITQGHVCLFGYCLYTSTLLSSTTSFTVSTTTRADSLFQATQDYIATLGGTATTTQALKASCNIFTSFDFYDCLTNLGLVLFFPSQGFQTYFTNTLYNGVLTHFPLGYITDFVAIISTSTVGSLVVLDATTSPRLPGGGAHIRLDLTGVLDQFLNATTGVFISSSATSTDTLYTITNRYWSYLIYILTVFYIMSRILGARLIPKIT